MFLGVSGVLGALGVLGFRGLGVFDSWDFVFVVLAGFSGSTGLSMRAFELPSVRGFFVIS